MKILQVCLKPPLPETDGGCKAMNVLTQGLLDQGNRVKVISISTYKHPFKKGLLDKNYLDQTNIECVYVNTRIHPLYALMNLFSDKPYNLTRFYSQEFEQLILKTLKKESFDVVLLESLFVTPYLETIKRSQTNIKIIYRAHNVESEIWRRRTSLTKGIKKLYFKLITKRLFAYEKNIFNEFDGIASISHRDKTIMKSMGAVKTINVLPFGVNSSRYKVKNKGQANTLFYIGSMDWKPNEKGVKWLLKEVIPKVQERFPSWRLRIAGRNMPEWLLNYSSDKVEICGEVDSAIEFISSNEIMLVPLFIGGGMRIKIIEGMVLQKPVVATSIAAEGIDCINKENILIADTPEEFVKAIELLITNKELSHEISKNAREMILKNYDNKVIVDNLLRFFRSTVE